MPQNLREKAANKLHGPDANPSQLGDPISLKAETSDSIPTDGEQGAGEPSSSSSSSLLSSASASSVGERAGGDETLRGKAAKKLHGPDANPSQLGDPISLKNETSPGVTGDGECGERRDEVVVVPRGSKL